MNIYEQYYFSFLHVDLDRGQLLQTCNMSDKYSCALCKPTCETFFNLKDLELLHKHVSGNNTEQ